MGNKVLSMELNDLSYEIIGAAIEVHQHLGGPGLLESIYEEALYHELVLRGLDVKRQVAIPVNYKGITIKNCLYLDLLVDDRIIIEVKSTELDNPISPIQLLTYLRLTGLKLGLLINFNKTYVKNEYNAL